MPTVRFTQNIQRHLSCPPLEAQGTTTREVLENYFSTNPQARSYVLDDQGHLRKHMAIFIDGRQIADRDRLTDPVTAESILDVVQSLSGGSE